MTERKLEKEVRQSSEKAHAIDATTQAVLDNLHRKDRRLRFWAISLFFILFAVGIIGIFYQNKLANQNKQHIDCIIKLFVTPAHPGQTRQIADLTTCQIKVSP
jgi:hypothetical protein